MATSYDEKRAIDNKQQDVIEPREPSIADGNLSDEKEAELERHEVFKKTTDGVNFRTVSWQRATIIFLKIQFALGVLSIPTSLYTLGAVGGALSILGWQILNTYTAIVLGDFRNRHPECHTLADMCGLMWGPWGKEFIGVMFLIAQMLCVGGGVLGISIAFNALSDHGACSVAFSFVACILITLFSTIRTLNRIGWLTWAGFASLFAAVLIVVVGVTTRDRPAAAPQTGPYDLGWEVISYPTFAAGMTASATIFISSSGSSNYMPVMSEMRRPRDYHKAALITGVLVGCMYLSFGLVVYRWCGQWVANPSLGSAGGLLKKIAYGIGLPGLIIGSGIYNHVAAKYLFVRILRNSNHLQANTVVHWTTWVSCNVILGILAFILAEAIPIFNYILALAGSICFAPMSLMIPAMLWMFDFKGYRTGSVGHKAIYGLHVLIVLVGAFMVVGGTYGTVISIKDAYASGEIGSAFSCADNSNTVG